MAKEQAKALENKGLHAAKLPIYLYGDCRYLHFVGTLPHKETTLKEIYSFGLTKGNSSVLVERRFSLYFFTKRQCFYFMSIVINSLKLSSKNNGNYNKNESIAKDYS